MAENDFDKKNSINSDSHLRPDENQQSTGPSENDNSMYENTMEIPVQKDQTIKLTPKEDKTVKFSNLKSKLEPSPLPKSPPTSPKLGKTPTNQYPTFIQSSSGGKKSILVMVCFIMMMGSIWYFLPPWLLSKAEEHSKIGRHMDSIKYTQWALYLYPRNIQKYRILLGKELRLINDQANAKKTLEKIVMNEPVIYYNALKEMGLTYLDLDLKQESFDTLKKYLLFKPEDMDALAKYAQLAYDLKKYNLSLQGFKVLTQKNPESAENWFRLGQSYFELDNMDESKKALKTSLRINNKIAGVQGLLGSIYMEEENYDKAVAAKKSEHFLLPTDISKAEAFAESCNQAGSYHESKRNWNEAIKFFEEGLTVESSQTTQFNYILSKLYFLRNGQKGRSLKYLRKAIEADPSLKTIAKNDPAFKYMQKSNRFQNIIR